MKTPVFFVLLAFVCLAQSKSFEGASSNDNLIESDSSSGKSPRIVNQPSTGLIEAEEKSLIPVNRIFKDMLLHSLPIVVAIIAKSKLVSAHMLFGAMFGILATVATCYYTPLCSYSLGLETGPADRMMELISPENLSTLGKLVETYEAMRQLN